MRELFDCFALSEVKKWFWKNQFLLQGLVMAALKFLFCNRSIKCGKNRSVLFQFCSQKSEKNPFSEPNGGDQILPIFLISVQPKIGR
jgi:hypothetical protein